MNIEARLNIPHGDIYTQESVKLLGEASSDILRVCANGLESVLAWLDRNNTERFGSLKFSWFTSTLASSAGSKSSDASATDVEKGEHKVTTEKTPQSVSEAMKVLKEVLERFKSNDR